MSDRPYVSKTVRDQQKASDPEVSAWVSAHAGSGKTHVLTQRVLRLLLGGAPPSQILCLTFTKAAAANMAARVFNSLARWALLDDAALAADIRATGASEPTRAELDFARRLFARAVETPGGLKIQTIHAFCEKVLHIFPFEANVPASFRVLDDMARADLLEEAKRRALQRAMRDAGDLRRALAIVARETTSAAFDDLCDELLGRREALIQAVDREDYEDRLRRRLGLQGNDSVASVTDEILDGRAHWEELAHALRLGSANDKKLAERLERATKLAPDAEGVDCYLSIFFTEKGDPRGAGKTRIITGGLVKQAPGLLERLEAERDRLGPLIEKRKAASTMERSLALATLGDAILDEYERAKRARNLLDYDDLIEKAQQLLNRTPSWVLYKLDSQVDHILLDEAQDTSARQWEILEAIANEFSAGAGARAAARSFFAVGDEKQSIFSFQGAAPEKFDAMRRQFAQNFRAVNRGFEFVQLEESFRSATDVLRAVDDVFNHGDNGLGLSASPLAEQTPLRHDAFKTHLSGLVEIWEPIGPQTTEEPADWRLPLDYAKASDPAERLARKIADKVRGLLSPDSRECVWDGEGRRPVAPGDILIVVRKRGALFEALIRALKSAGAPVAGADRLDLAKHIAVNDFVALGRAVLLPEDDLTLATALKSPLLGLDDDDLLALAPRRRGSLHEALATAENARHAAAAEKIAAWRRLAASLPPFEFYSRLLGPDGGRRQLVARLGPEANDAIDEFLRLALVHERESSASLVDFLSMVEKLDLSIKRDMEAAGGAVRVMTAHAAKGLEAKIVFLPDTCGAPAGKHDPRLFTLGEDGALSLVWSVNRETNPAAIEDARARSREAERAEHQRLLYVAMTRAEERLYVAGHHGKNGPAAGCWHETMREALEPGCEKSSDADGYVLRRGGVPPLPDAPPPATAAGRPELPLFARTPAPKEIGAAPPLRPSSALEGADSFAAPGAAALTRSDAERALIGRLTHALLQHLPDCPAPRRAVAAERFLARRGAALDEETRARIVASTLALIADPQLAALFGAQSAAEVEIVAALGGGRAVSGRIDRLAENGREVWIADFKTGRPREALDASQLRQLALYRAALAPLYPQKLLRCFVVWTQTATAVEAEAAALDEALARAIAD